MAVVLKSEAKEEIIKEYNRAIEKNQVPANIKKILAGKYNISIKAIRKILKNAESKLITNNQKSVNTSLSKIYIFTSWDIRVGIDKNFVKLLLQVAEQYNAQIVISCLNDKDYDYLIAAIQKLKITDDISKSFFIPFADFPLNENLQYKHVQNNYSAYSPIASWEGVFNKSTVVNGLVKDLKTEKSNIFCKQIMSTGSIGKLNARYEDYDLVENRKEFDKRWAQVNKSSKAMTLAQEAVEPSALIIDIADSKIYFTRYITKKKDTYLYDRNLKFTLGKKPEKIKPKSLVIGDWHSIETCPLNLKAIQEIAKEYQPESAILNDFISFNGINHHEWLDYVNVIKAPTLEQEKAVAVEHLDLLEKLFPKTYYLSSNHDAFLSKFLMDETKYKLNIHNYKTALDLRSWTMDTGKHPIIKFLDLDKRPKIQFISESQDLSIAGITVKHGHEGLLGQKAGFRTMAKAYNYKYVQGHLHTLDIFRGAAMCGTSSKLRLGYNKGLSNWLQAHLLLYEDGTVQNITVIDGRW